VTHARLPFRKPGSWLGLLAILLIALAPTVSQLLAQHGRLHRILDTYCSASPIERAVESHAHAGHAVASHWEACPYCGLFAHAPVLPGVARAPIGAVAASGFLVLPAASAVRLAPLFSRAHARAPPEPA
jgi:hypothetical protein